MSRNGKKRFSCGCISAIVAVFLLFCLIIGAAISSDSEENVNDTDKTETLDKGVNDDNIEETTADNKQDDETVKDKTEAEDTTKKPETEKAPETTVHTHNFALATCTAPKTCLSCGVTDGIANGHSWQGATCTSPKKCITCSLEEGSANGHDWENATCSSAKYCHVCGATEGNALGHNWKDATYSAPKTCLRCSITEGSALTVPGSANYNGHVYTGGQYSEKYHYEAHCAGKNSHEITWEEVERRGLEPCGTCVLK